MPDSWGRILVGILADVGVKQDRAVCYVKMDLRKIDEPIASDSAPSFKVIISARIITFCESF